MQLTATHKMGIAALIMGGSIFLSRIMGLVRDKVVSWQFGAGAEADIYFAAFVVPDFLNYLLAGGYISITLIPILSKRFEENPADGWRFFSTVFTWAGLSIGLLTAVAWVFAPQLSVVVAPGFDAAQSARLALFLRIILPAQLFFLLGACVSALLYIRKQFYVPAITPLVYNACIIGGGVLLGALYPERGMEGFCWGVLGGAVLGAFILPVWAARRGGLTLCVSFAHPLMKRFIVLALPLMVGQSVVVLDEQFVRIFGSLAGEGAVSLLNYARRIMLVPVGVVAQAAGVASYPFLAALIARNDEPAFNQTLHSALRGSLLIIIPATGLMIALAAPILGLIFEGGRFNASQTLSTAPLLQIMLLAVPFWAVQQVMGRAFYARQNTLTPAIVGTVATLAVLPVYPWAVGLWNAAGVALLTTVSLVAYTVALSLVWRARHGSAAFTGLFRETGACLVLTILCGIAAHLCAQTVRPFVPVLFAQPLMQTLALYTVILGAGTLTFALPYLLAARVVLPSLLHIRRRTR